jgi:hypothetical protein
VFSGSAFLADAGNVAVAASLITAVRLVCSGGCITLGINAPGYLLVIRIAGVDI